MIKNLLKKFYPVTEEKSLILFTLAYIMGSGAFWIFPLKVYQSGGISYFFLLAITLVFFTIPVLGAEMLAGRVSQAPLLNSFSTLRRPKWKFLGYLMMLAFILFAFYFSESFISSLTLLEKSFFQLFKNETGWNHADSGFLPYLNIIIVVIASYFLLTSEIFRFEFLSPEDHKTRTPFKLKSLSWLFILAAFSFILNIFLFLRQSPISVTQIFQHFFSLGNKTTGSNMLMGALSDSFFIFLAGRGVLLAFSAFFKKETGITTFAIRFTALGILIAFIVSFLLTGVLFYSELEGGEVTFHANILYETIPQIFLKLSAGKIMLLFFSLTLCIIFGITLAGWMEIMGSSTALILNMPRSAALKVAGLIFFIAFVSSHYYNNTSFNIPTHTQLTHKFISPDQLAADYGIKGWEEIKFAVSGTVFPEKYFTKENIPENNRPYYSFEGNKETQTISVVINKPAPLVGLSNLSLFILEKYFIPVLVLLMAIFVGWVLPESVKRTEFARGDSYYSKYYNIWNVLIKYFVPGASLLLLFFT